ncbi:MAG: hypothetical protein JWO44_2068 [Bacteroidetes bacterium]|nr:hypothetical protein [Bacteroidota bacterium]
MARKALILIFIIFICSLHVRAQAPVSASFGAGFKSPFGTVGIFIMGVDISDRITYQLGPAINISYSGMGATTGFKWAFLKARKYSASFNVDYQFLLSRNISKLFDSDKRFSTYRTPNMHHVFAGASFNVNMSNFVRNLKDDKFSLNMNYGFGLSNYQPLLVAGDPNDGIRKNITRQISSGIGFSVTYTAYLFNN